MPSAASYAKRRRSSQAGLGLTAAGAGVALICVPVACVWFLMRSDFGATAADAAVLAQSKALMTQMAAVQPAPPKQVAAAPAPPEQIAAVPTPQETAPEATFDLASADTRAVDLDRGRPATADLFDPPHTASIPSTTFQKNASRPAEDRFVAVAPPPATTAAKPQAAATIAVAVPRPARAPTRKPVQTASLAMPAPSEFRAPPSPSPLLDQKVAKNKVLSNAAVLKMFEKILKKPAEQQVALGYAPTDGGVLGDGASLVPAGSERIDQYTAVYDVSAATVYMPDGTKLEAHSGLGPMKDDPSNAHVRMRGVTPPHVYDLKLRESLFHGVRAIRLTPVGGERAIFGRNGILAHTYMLGPRGDSNGCVSFKDYNAFLQAYLKGDVKRMIVVARLD